MLPSKPSPLDFRVPLFHRWPRAEPEARQRSSKKMAFETQQAMTTQANDQAGSREWWLEKSHYLRSWDKRAKVAARFCGDGFVCDIGCGMMGLNRYLPLQAR